MFGYNFINIMVFGMRGVGKTTFIKKSTENFFAYTVYCPTYIHYTIKKVINKAEGKKQIIEDINEVHEFIKNVKLEQFKKLYKDQVIWTKYHSPLENALRFGFEVKLAKHMVKLCFLFEDEGSQVVCRSFINTRSAEEFIEAHKKTIKLLEIFENYGFEVEIDDETEYANRRQEKILLEARDKLTSRHFSYEYKGNLYFFTISNFSDTDDSILPLSSIFTRAVILLYDITNPQSLEFIPRTIQIVRKRYKKAPILLVGNKADLRHFRKVHKNEGIELAKTYNLTGFTEISSKRGIESMELLVKFSEDVIERKRFEGFNYHV